MTERETLELTWERFRELRHGAVIQTGRGTLRLVLQGPGDVRRKLPLRPTSKAWIWVPIHRRSWTNRAETMLNFYDLTCGPYSKPNPSRIVPVRSARALCELEREILRGLGFDWVREWRRELAESERLGYIPTVVRDWLDRFTTRFEKHGKP